MIVVSKILDSKPDIDLDYLEGGICLPNWRNSDFVFDRYMSENEDGTWIEYEHFTVYNGKSSDIWSIIVDEEENPVLYPIKSDGPYIHTIPF